MPTGYDESRYREVGYAEGYAIGRLAPLYIPIGMNDSIQRAVEKAIEENGGDAITDVIVTQRYSINPIFVSHGVKVRGLVLREIPEDERARSRDAAHMCAERGGQLIPREPGAQYYTIDPTTGERVPHDGPICKVDE